MHAHAGLDGRQRVHFSIPGASREVRLIRGEDGYNKGMAIICDPMCSLRSTKVKYTRGDRGLPDRYKQSLAINSVYTLTIAIRCIIEPVGRPVQAVGKYYGPIALLL